MLSPWGPGLASSELEAGAGAGLETNQKKQLTSFRFYRSSGKGTFLPKGHDFRLRQGLTGWQ